MNINEFDEKVFLLGIVSRELKKLSKELHAIDVETNSSTALSTTFTVLLKKGKYSFDDVNIVVRVEFGYEKVTYEKVTNGRITISGQNIVGNGYKNIDITEQNVRDIRKIIKEFIKEKKEE
jgi:hypothetical protein